MEEKINQVDILKRFKFRDGCVKSVDAYKYKI